MIRNDAVRAVQDLFWQAGERLMYHHTNPWELDAALCAWGYDLGVCEAQDLLGLDKVLARLPERAVPILSRMVAEGRIGKVGGVGYFRYPGGGGAVIDPLIEDLILEEAWFGKVTRSDLPDDALVIAMHHALHPICAELRNAGADKTEVTQLLHRAIHFPLNKMPDWL